jgi:SAM-dependent methyltransferase
MAWLRWDGVRRALRSTRPSSILEIGAGQGAVGARLAARGDYVGVEPDAESAAVARRRVGANGAVIEGTIDDAPPDLRADLVCAFEVLEHIEDDVAALGSWRQRLTPGGFILISVPAHQHRFGPADELVGHHRRYGRDDLRTAVEAVGFTVRRIEPYGFGLGHALEAARNRIVARRLDGRHDVGTPGSGRLFQPGRGVGVLTALVALPGRAVQRLSPRPDRGVGWLLLAEAPGSPREETNR